MNIHVGDRVYYKDSLPVYTVVKFHHDGDSADVRHDNGHVYTGYIVSNMKKYEKEESDYIFEQKIKLEKEAEMALHLGYYEMAAQLMKKAKAM
tara:strand:+ start:9488 stop:9766 length:279 start_codon:yes stop_codon:yes gene_type:complete